MAPILRSIKSVIAATVVLLASKTFSYAAVLDGGVLRNIQTDSGQNFQISASTPEPATMLLLGIGLVLLAGVARKGRGSGE